MLTAARARLETHEHVRVLEGELEALPVDDHHLDIATLFLALHHVPDLGRALLEARRVLRPGGRLLVVDMMPHDREAYREEMGHVWLGFSDAEMQRLLSAAGFEEARYHPLPTEADSKGPALFVAVAETPQPAALATPSDPLTQSSTPDSDPTTSRNLAHSLE